jgi:putative FmdB family regulatory protein
MPLYDFSCCDCNVVKEHIAKYSDRKSAEFKCECGGSMAYLFSGSATYHPSIERLMELERGHLPTYRPAPVSHSSSGAGVRKFAGYTGGES